ncbi:MAG: hypothetical protein H8E36_07625 [Rhodospirillaceae bacterium]|nr:hypothetical protein [Rhodospirillaceae bacterium]MBL6942675.1 hypothetical protein [Rhodospirillales bacterium]
MDNEYFSYEKWVEEALRNVIKRALEQTALQGLPGDHHFFITFLTGHDNVDIPAHLRLEHPEEMTIVLQHQFQNLTVTNDGFSVSLSFSGRSCLLSIPFAAITAFADPAVNFVLQLKTSMPEDNTQTKDGPAPVAAEALAAAEATPFQPAPAVEDDKDELPRPEQEDDEGDKMGEVIALDTFRKK